jgi:hypothetical protein
MGIPVGFREGEPQTLSHSIACWRALSPAGSKPVPFPESKRRVIREPLDPVVCSGIFPSWILSGRLLPNRTRNQRGRLTVMWTIDRVEKSSRRAVQLHVCTPR